MRRTFSLTALRPWWWVLGLLLWGALVPSCTCERGWLPPSSRQENNCSLDGVLPPGGSQDALWGCLEVVRGTQRCTAPVRLRRDGELSGLEGDTPSCTLAASGGAQARFRVYVLYSEQSPPTDLETRCEAWKHEEPTCDFAKAEGRCWFWLEFKPTRQGELAKDLAGTQATCRMHVRGTAPGEAVSSEASTPDGRTDAGPPTDLPPEQATPPERWDCAPGAPYTLRHTYTLEDVQFRYTDVAFQDSYNHVGATSWDGKMVLWNLVTDLRITLLTLQNPDEHLTSLAFNPVGRSWAVGLEQAGGSGRVTLSDGTQKSDFPTKTLVRSVAFSPDGSKLAYVHGLQAELMELSTKKVLHTMLSSQGGLHRVTFDTQNTSVIASTAGGFVYVWNQSDGKLKQVFTAPGTPRAPMLLSVAINPAGTLVAAGGNNGTVYVWETDKQRLRLELKGHTGNVHGVAFSPKGGLLASGANDVRLWSIPDGKLLQTLSEPAGTVTNVAFRADGSFLAASSYDKKVHAWGCFPP